MSDVIEHSCGDVAPHQRHGATDATGPWDRPVSVEFYVCPGVPS